MKIMTHYWKWFLRMAALMFVGSTLAMAQNQQGDVQHTFVTLTAPGNTPLFSTVIDSPYELPFIHFPLVHVVQAVVTGSPTACTFQLAGSALRVSQNPTGSQILALGSGTATTCTSSTFLFITYQPVPTIQIQLLTLSGGTSPTVTFTYLGKQ